MVCEPTIGRRRTVPIDRSMTVPAVRRPTAMPRRILAWATLVLATVYSALSLADQIIRIMGRTPPWTAGDDPQEAAWRVFVAVSVLTFIALALSIHTMMPGLPIGRAARIAGRLLAISYTTLAAAFAMNMITGLPEGGLGPTYYALGGAAFTVMFVSAMLLGAGLLRDRTHLASGILLASAAPAVLIATTIALTGATPAHPAIGEAFVYLATALLAVRLSRRHTGTNMPHLPMPFPFQAS